MRVVILGGSGFIGTALAAELLKRGHEAIISSRYRRTVPDMAEPSVGGVILPNRAGKAVLVEKPLLGSSTVQDGTGEEDIYPPFLFAEDLEGLSRQGADTFSSSGKKFLKGKETSKDSVDVAGMELSSDARTDPLRWEEWERRREKELEQQKGAMVREFVEAASAGEKLSVSFWRTAEKLGENPAQADLGLLPATVGSEVRESGIKRKAEYVVWDGLRASELIPLLEQADAVVNLVGEYPGGRWTADKKRGIRESRVRAGYALSQALSARASAGVSLPKVVVQASASGYYGLWKDWEKAPVCDESDSAGEGFLAAVALQWEKSTAIIPGLKKRENYVAGVRQKGSLSGSLPGYGGKPIRRCVVRMAPVMGNGGFLRQILPLFKTGFGGVPGNGRQPFSWIHISDAVRAMVFLLEKEDAAGAYNLCAPETGTMRQFCEALGWVLHRPVWVPMPEISLRFAMGGVADEMLLSGQRMSSGRIQDEGFSFLFSDVDKALKNTVQPGQPRYIRS